MRQIPEAELLFHVASSEYRPEYNMVRVTHLPTGISEASGEHRSILRNKKEALRRLAAKLERR